MGNWLGYPAQIFLDEQAMLNDLLSDLPGLNEDDVDDLLQDNDGDDKDKDKDKDKK